MNLWEIGTWLAVIVLGPGAVGVFVLFLRDAKRIVREMKDPNADR
jgi:hypothetical protein